MMRMSMIVIVCQWERRVESYGDITVELVRLGMGKGEMGGVETPQVEPVKRIIVAELTERRIYNGLGS